MRIGFITLDPPFARSGAGTYATCITESLALAGHDVHLVLPLMGNAPMAWEENGVLRHGIPFSDKPYLRAASFWRNLRREFAALNHRVGRFDIIHSHDLSDWSLGVRDLGGTPRVMTVHHLSLNTVEAMRPSVQERLRDTRGELGYIKPLMERRSIRRADAIIAVSRYTMRQVLLHCDIQPESVTVVYPGYARMQAAGGQDEAEVRRRFGLRPGQPVLLFVGDPDNRRKGFDTLRAAFAQVRREVDAVLVAVGGHRPTGGKLASEEEGIVLAGFVDDATLGALYSMCDVFISAARLEGFGLAILDAMAFGKPVVATRVGAVPEVVIENVNGLLVNCDDCDQMAGAIVQLLTDRSFASSIAMRNAMETAGRFSWHRAAVQTVGVYEKLLDEVPGGSG